ncbi:hypothetical protein RSAG8_12530, partial [Rhizoctonia solani AG-8 WAC10335]
MTVQPNKDTSNEWATMELRKANLIGTFTVFLNQTRNHPDQRALDQEWVDQLVERIGMPGVLNRALHPISAILEDETWDEELSRLLEEKGKDSAPYLPDGAQVLVFAGQHRLAMLSQLDLGGSGQLWWHAQIYKRELETKHPAEFLTMMHESNSPQVMKSSSDVDLFRAVRKLKSLLKSGIITQQIFLENRRMLLSGSDERINRAICNLTRNEELMDTIGGALARVHIAKVFSAGSWMRITTGRLYMVAIGLIREMTAQVDQLTEGMSEVPEQVLSLQPRVCLVSKLKGFGTKRKSQPHAWDILPGGREAALKRAVVRPLNFVTRLNPKKDDSWSLPHMVLLPSCLGSKLVEDELRLMQTVTNHIIKMVSTEEQYDQYNSKGNPETLEGATDHPAGVIALFLTKMHPNDPNVRDYEYKILHRIWVNRTKLHEQLDEYNIPPVESTSEDYYQKLIDASEDWWSIMRLFKVPQLPSKLTVPKVFASNSESNTTETSGKETSGVGTLKHQKPKRTASATNSEPIRKRVRPSLSQRHQPTQGLGDKGAEQGAGRSGAGGGDAPVGGRGDMPQDPPIPSSQDLDLVREDEDILIDPHESGEEQDGRSSIHNEEREGGDRRLAKALDQLTRAMDSMTRSESRAMTELLGQIMASKKNGDMEHMVKGLVSKGKRIASKLEKMHFVDYDSPTELPGVSGGDDLPMADRGGKGSQEVGVVQEEESSE